LSAHERLVSWAAETCATKSLALVLNGSKPTVGKWCQHFIEHCVAGLYD
jgi:hypothetical protein